MEIEQTLTLVSREGGRKVVRPVAATEGILPVDTGEITGWSRAFEFPLDGRFDLLNLFFHPLPSGRFAIGRLTPRLTCPNGRIDQKKRPDAFFIQTMVIDPDLFLAFGNHPVLLYQKILATGKLPFVTDPPKHIEPIPVVRDESWFDANLLCGMAIDPGGRGVAELVRSAIASPCTLFAGGPPAIHLISAIFHLLPIHCRTELTFSTGLHFSPSRYLRLVGVAKKSPILSEIRNRYPVPYLDLDRLAAEPPPVRRLEGWPGLVEAVLDSGKIEWFEKKIAAEFREATSDRGTASDFFQNAETLGNRWLADMTAEFGAEIRTDRQTERPNLGEESKGALPPELKQKLGKIFAVRDHSDNAPPPRTLSEKLKNWLAETDPDETIFYYRESPEPFLPRPFSPKPFLTEPFSAEQFSSKPPRRPPTPNKEPLFIYTEQNRLFSPFQRLLAEWPNLERDFLELDSHVGRALAGGWRGVEPLERYWGTLQKQLPEGADWAVREEYIHYVQAALTRHAGADLSSPQKSLAALEVLDLFLNEVAP